MAKMVVDVEISWGTDSDGFLRGAGRYEIELPDGVCAVGEVTVSGAIEALKAATLNLRSEMEAEIEKQTRGLA